MMHQTIILLKNCLEALGVSALLCACLGSIFYIANKLDKKGSKMHTYHEKGEKYTKDTLWGTVDGRRIPIRCLADAHLANIILHIRSNERWYNEELLEVLLKEALDRNLSQEFLDSAPIPWQDVDGKWKRLNKEQNDYEVIGR